ncbi:flagellar biosynthesis protein FlhB [Roseixanthobacter liquoris]|uniref:flagellar biosynthesis protein FlhB n=1 Tax=Roseixanthobacter liquoris TaxID=3119921 RepID=UPI00372CC8A2
MSEAPDKESQTEEASEKKINDAVEKGNVPFSREVTLFASLVGILLCLTFFASNPVRRLADDLARFIDDPGGFRLEESGDAVDLLMSLLMVAARFLTPIVIILALAGVVATVFQNMPRVVLDRITPKWSRVSPVEGWSRIFGTQGHVEFGKSLFKFFVIGLVCAILLYSQQYQMVNAMFSDPLLIPSVVLSLSTRLVSAVCIGTITLVGADLAWSRFHWRADLRMSHQELKDEFKQAEGDPMVKARMRALAQQRARQRMLTNVPKASLVIANPTHYAIALQYDRAKGGAPLVVAKGMDLIALKIREIAERNDIPVIEDRALARAMYDAVQVDQWIPNEFYRPVAKILYFIYSRKPNARP